MQLIQPPAVFTDAMYKGTKAWLLLESGIGMAVDPELLC
jgi:hypothetical protein